MAINYNEVEDGEADVPWTVKSKRSPNLDKEKRKEKESKGEKASKIRLKLKHFFEGQDKPWNDETQTLEVRNEAKLKYTQFINGLIHSEIIFLDDSLFKESLTNTGKPNFTHEVTTIYCVNKSRQVALDGVKQMVTNHILQWKGTPIEFRQQFGII